MQGIKASSVKNDPAQRIAALVQSVILLKETLTAMPGLAKILAPAKSELLKAVSCSLPGRHSIGRSVLISLPWPRSAELDEDA